jgi:solute carrier family 35 protein E4
VWVLACAFILSVALSNIGIKHVEVSFAMTIGATAPLFTVIISAIVLAKQYSRFVYMSLVPIIVGMLMASKGEMHFDMVGFTCCTIGVIFRAVKSVIQQLILTDEKEKLNSIELLYYMSQPCILINGVWALAAESQDVIIDPVTYQTETAILYIITCCLAVSMNITTFLVTFLTSAVTLQILGQIKVVATILLSLVLFHNSMSLMGGFGCMLTISGAAAYAHVKDWKVAGAVAPSL